MKEVLIFAGTTEGRQLSEYLAAAEIYHTVCVATEYGELVLDANPFVKIHQGRMDQKEIENFIKDRKFAAVADATHPYAKDVTRNIKTAVTRLNLSGYAVPYLRLNRELIVQNKDDRGPVCHYFETNEACAEALEQTSGNILLTTGSKELSKYCVSEELKRRLYVRVLPGIESISLCMDQGICGKQIIAMQGPFTLEMNEAMIRQYHISHLVTKESGISGGYPEKIEAAEKTGTQVFVIGRAEESGGYTFSEICRELEKICGIQRSRAELPFGNTCMSKDRGKAAETSSGNTCMPEKQGSQLDIILAGIGMGHKHCLTKEVEKAISEADILLGAERMLADFHPKSEKRPLYQAKQIIPYLEEMQKKNLLSENKKAVVLLSGDSGFYSGCQHLYAALTKEIQEGRLKASLRIMPGISSVSYLASCIGESYQDAAIYSMHGKKLCNLVRKIKNHSKLFLLTSGVKDINSLGRMLVEAGLTDCEVIAGNSLSYENQKIERYTPAECCELKEEGLYTCFVKNPGAENKKLTHGMTDEAFIRGKVPMTKEEVREVSICKLRLHDRAVVYDIGSGTGSVAVEIAGLSDNVQVYALEQKKEAVSLIEQNKERFHLQNLTVTETMAPEGLSELPTATHAFIGGSKGRLKEILASLRQINPRMRIVINAVSMETICEIREVLSVFKIKEEEIVQLQASRARKAGNYHLMQSENPVWICAFYFAEEETPAGEVSISEEKETAGEVSMSEGKTSAGEKLL